MYQPGQTKNPSFLPLEFKDKGFDFRPLPLVLQRFLEALSTMLAHCFKARGKLVSTHRPALTIQFTQYPRKNQVFFVGFSVYIARI